MTSETPTVSKLDFTERRVLVTGGASGIGKAIAIKFLDLNATVIVLDKDVTLLKKLVQEYPSIQTAAADLRNWDDTRKAVEGGRSTAHSPLATWQIMQELVQQLDVNFKAALNVAQVVAKGMITNNISNGTIVNTSSIGDVMTSKNESVYCATKAAVTILTKSMAVELAPHGIRVNCVSPGLVNTELVANLPEEYKKNSLGPFYDRLLFKEITEPEAIADAIVFLSSTMSSRITTTRLAVDQGTTVT